MKNSIICGVALGAYALLSTSGSETARAQLWSPLMMVPHPNVIIAHDTSVTMGIDDNCNNCHIPGRDRLATSKIDIAQTLPEFDQYFNYGSFRYSGCGSAKIVLPIILPMPNDPPQSLAAVLGSINGAQACGSKESNYPGGNSGNCATPNCNDQPVLMALWRRGLPGFDPLGPFLHRGCAYDCNTEFAYCDDVSGELPPDGTPTLCASTTVAQQLIDRACSPPTCMNGGCYHVSPFCTTPLGMQYNPATIVARLSAIEWPRWERTGLTAVEVEAGLCAKMRPILRDVWNELAACRPDRYGTTGNPDIEGTSWCDPNVLANSACGPGSPLLGTCVCDSANPLCQRGGRRVSECGVGLDWKARQQVAVCEAYDPAPGGFQDFYESQPDNVVNPGGCRENAVLFFTDGYMGGTRGVALEAAQALGRGAYVSGGGYQNMAVFRVANSFTGDANQMMTALSNGDVTTAYRATDRASMQEGFARLLNRTYRGVYTGTSLSQDTYGTRAAYNIFSVPGYRFTAGRDATSFVDSYLGWPSRLAVHAIRDDGTISAAPIFETDWSSKANRTVPGCRAVIGDVATGNSLGLTGNFRTGRSRRLNVGIREMDRDGDGTLDNTQPITLGQMFGIGSTKVVVVDAPAEAKPTDATGFDYLTFQADPRVRLRPRMYYVMGNGVLHGYYGGAYRAGGMAGRMRLKFSYDDSGADAGVEVVRFTPSWLNSGTSRYTFGMNDLVQQPMTTGQLVSREVRLSGGWKTVLVGAQGSGGGGFFSVDVTDPCQARPIAEWSLPAGDVASSEPTIYTFPQAAMPRQRPVVVATGGLRGSNRLYAFDIETGAELSRITLPAGTYPSAAVCADLEGLGTITGCYVVREDGHLMRVTIANNRFDSVADITPAGVGGGGMVFHTHPAVYFVGTGEVAIVYGSGDTQQLTQGVAQNYVYKVVDNDNRKSGAGTGRLTNVCRGNGGSGAIALQPGERLVSPPIIRAGVVAWSAFSPDATAPGCNPGRSSIYAMNFESCNDAQTDAPLPVARPGPDGLPTSPELHAYSGTILVNSAAGPTASQTVPITVRTRGANGTWAKRTYWRLEGGAP